MAALTITNRATSHDVDVIVCTYNRATQLANLLHGLKVQTMSSDLFRILIIDDGSSDGTQELCPSHSYSLPNLKYERATQNGGLSNARNIGLSLSSAPFVLFTDDDCVPHPDWVKNMVEALRKAPIVAGAIEPPEDNFWQLCHNISEFHPFMIGSKAREVRFIAGANMGFRREAIDFLGGFEPDRPMAEDMELALRAGSHGRRIHFSPAAIVKHNPQRSSFLEIIKYSAVHAQSTIHLRRAYRSLLRIPFLFLSAPFLFLLSPGIAAITTLKILLSNPALFRRHPCALPVVFLTKFAWCIGACQGLRSREET